MVLEVSDHVQLQCCFEPVASAVMAEVGVRVNTHLKARRNKSESKEEPGS